MNGIDNNRVELSRASRPLHANVIPLWRMFDKPHKTGPDALKELNDLSLETRRHLHGLFERPVEGLIILVFQFVTVIALLDLLPESEWLLGLLFPYTAFSIFWVLRSIGLVRTAIIGSFTKEELAEGKTYERYCMGGWFLRTIGVLIIATIALGVLLYITV